MVNVTRTCARCSAYHGKLWCDRFKQKTLPGAPICSNPRNGWGIEWKASSVVWVMDSDGDWELYMEGHRFYLGLVGANSTRTKWMAFYKRDEIGPFDDVRDAAKALIARVKGETGG